MTKIFSISKTLIFFGLFYILIAVNSTSILANERVFSGQISMDEPMIEIADWQPPVARPYSGWGNDIEQTRPGCNGVSTGGYIMPAFQNAYDNDSPLYYEYVVAQNYPVSKSVTSYQTFADSYNDTSVLADQRFYDEGNYELVSVQATDRAGNRSQKQMYGCKWYLDRTPPKTKIIGLPNELSLEPNSLTIKYTVDDDLKPVHSVMLYTRFSTDPDNFTNDFAPSIRVNLDPLVLQDGTQVYEYPIENYWSSPGYMQFMFIAIDYAGLETEWPADLSEIPIVKITDNENINTGKFKMTITDKTSDVFVLHDNYRNLNFDDGGQGWMTNKNQQSVSFANGEAVIAKNENATLNNQSETHNWEALEYYFTNLKKSDFNALTFDFKINAHDDLPGIYDQILNYEFCGQKGAIGREIFETELGQDNNYSSGWKKIILNHEMCDDNQEIGLKFGMAENIDAEEEILIYIDNIELSAFIVNEDSQLEVDFNELGSEAEENAIICHGTSESGAQLRLINEDAISESNVVRFKLSEKLKDNVLDCKLVKKDSPDETLVERKINVYFNEQTITHESTIDNDSLLEIEFKNNTASLGAFLPISLRENAVSSYIDWWPYMSHLGMRIISGKLLGIKSEFSEFKIYTQFGEKINI